MLHGLSQMALPPGRMCGKCAHAPRLHHQRAEKTWQQGVDTLLSVPIVWFFLGPTTGTRRNLQHRRGHPRTPRMCSSVLGELKLAVPGISTEPRGLTATQSRPADLFATAAVPGRSAALDVCVGSTKAAAQAALDRKLSNYRQEIPDLCNQSIRYRSLVWTADGRPHPAVTRTLQYAADTASSRNGQQMSAKSLQHRWKHEIQIALLRRRASVTRPVLPNPSARA